MKLIVSSFYLVFFHSEELIIMACCICNFQKSFLLFELDVVRKISQKSVWSFLICEFRETDYCILSEHTTIITTASVGW